MLPSWHLGPDSSLEGGYPMHCRMFSSTPGLYALDANVCPLPLPQLWQPKISPGIAKYSLGSTIAPSWECLIHCTWGNFHRCFLAVCGWRPSCWKLTFQVQHKKEHISYNFFYVVVGTFPPLGSMVTVIINIFKYLLCTRNFAELLIWHAYSHFNLSPHCGRDHSWWHFPDENTGLKWH